MNKIVIPDERTRKGVECWVRNHEDHQWEHRVFLHINHACTSPFATVDGLGYVGWKFCRLDNPETGWVENYGVMPVDPKTEVEVKFTSGLVCRPTPAIKCNWDKSNSVIAYWRYPREEMTKQLTAHPQADILRRIADGEDLYQRLWCLGNDAQWHLVYLDSVITSKNSTFAISDKPGVPPLLPLKKIQLREGGLWYYPGEITPPGDNVKVWLARPATANQNRARVWCGIDKTYRDDCLRLGLVHLSEYRYELHMNALEDFLEWVKVHGDVK